MLAHLPPPPIFVSACLAAAAPVLTRFRATGNPAPLVGRVRHADRAAVGPAFRARTCRLFGQVDTAGFLERAVAHLNALAPDLVLITGDLTRTATSGSMPRLADDCRQATSAVFRADRQSRRPRADAPAVRRGSSAGARAAATRSTVCRAPDRARHAVEAGPGGRLGTEQLAWLDARLAEAPGGRRWWRCIIRRSAPASATWTARCCAMPTRSRR